MQKRFITTYLVIVATLLIMMSLSRLSTEKMRGGSVAMTSPFWEKVLSVKHFFLHPFQPSPFVALTLEEEKLKFQLEKKLLQSEIETLQAQLDEQRLLNLQIAQVDKSEKKTAILNYRLHAIPARVIFRSFDGWDQALWINAGESSNPNAEEPVIALNSPVVVGSAIVGVVDYVGNKQSRVRLITDSRLNPSVRASRGGEQDYYLNDHIEKLSLLLSNKKQTPLSQEDHTQLTLSLDKLKKGLQPFNKTSYLAKGELRGISPTSKRKEEIILKGTGFNYDFPDAEGDSRDLRTGESVRNPKEPAIPILKVHDILVTTGMDGLFPPGFQVAVITKIDLLKEGDYYYELEARPVALPLEELSLVFVLPPIHKEEMK